MKRLGVIMTAVLLAAPVAAGETTVSLRAAETQDPADLPFRSASLTIVNKSPEVICSVRLRERVGGPTFIYFVTIAPKTRQLVSVALPAVTSQQSYTISLLAGERADSPVVSAFERSINWPVPAVEASKAAFYAPQEYNRYEFESASWPTSFRRNVFLAAVLCCAALAGVLFIRPPLLRGLAIVLVISGAAAAMTVLVLSEPILVTPAVKDSSLIVVTCRRTTDWTTYDANLMPIYRNREHMAGDATVIYPGRSVKVSLSPGEVRLFRRRK